MGGEGCDADPVFAGGLGGVERGVERGVGGRGGVEAAEGVGELQAGVAEGVGIALGDGGDRVAAGGGALFDEAAFGGAAFVEDDDACALQAHARAEHPRAQDAVEVDEGVAAELGGEAVHAGHAHIVLAQADAADGEVGGGIDEERGEGAARDHDELGVGVRAAGVVEDGDDEGYVAERGEAHDGVLPDAGSGGLRARCFVLIF